MKVLFDLDDLSPRNTQLSLLEELKEHFPKFKVTMFMVPWEIRLGEPTPITDERFKPFCDALIKGSDWIEVAVHGLTHAPEEFKTLGYEEAKKRIMVAEKMIINRGIPYTKLFKAPYWLLTKGGKEAAEELGFTVAEDGYYDWNIKDPLPRKKGDLIAHGHVQNVMGNGLEESYYRLLELPADTEFGFLSEHYKTKKVYPESLNFDPVMKGGAE